VLVYENIVHKLGCFINIPFNKRENHVNVHGTDKGFTSVFNVVCIVLSMLS